MPNNKGNGLGIVAEPIHDGVQEMHDMINRWLNDDSLTEVLHKDDIMALNLYRDALCWVLGHDNNAMSDNIGTLMDVMAEAGFFGGH